MAESHRAAKMVPGSETRPDPGSALRDNRNCGSVVVPAERSRRKAMPSKPLEPGDPVRLGRFELLGRLGEGGQGVVYLGRGTHPGEERVAVKVLRSTADADVLERLARELDAIHQVQPFVTAGVIEASTITSGLIGTPSYVSPEQLAGARPTSAVDIFAWALTIIYAATGRLAFGADNVPAVMHRIMYEQPDVSGLPPSLRAVVLECLDKDPSRRPTARDLLLRLVDPSASRPQ